MEFIAKILTLTRANTGFQPSEKERKEKLPKRQIEEMIEHIEKRLDFFTP